MKFMLTSQQMGRAFDICSFYNVSPEMVIDAIQAAFNGDPTPIRTFGVALDVTSDAWEQIELQTRDAEHDFDKVGSDGRWEELLPGITDRYNQTDG